MSELMTTALAGGAAGLGVAMPVGGVGVLLMQEGMRERRAAAAAALAVALVDLLYAGVATALGPLVAAALTGVEAWVRLAAALVLMAIAVRGLVASCSRTDSAPGPGTEERVPGPARTFVRFSALTLVNPTTALYFAALATAQGARLGGAGAGVLFVACVFAASLFWQQLLVAAAGLAGARLPASGRAWTFRIGFGLVALFAVKVALPLPS